MVNRSGGWIYILSLFLSIIIFSQKQFQTLDKSALIFIYLYSARKKLTTSADVLQTYFLWSGWRCGIFPCLPRTRPGSNPTHYVDWVFSPYLTAWVFKGNTSLIGLSSHIVNWNFLNCLHSNRFLGVMIFAFQRVLGFTTRMNEVKIVYNL